MIVMGIRAVTRTENDVVCNICCHIPYRNDDGLVQIALLYFLRSEIRKYVVGDEYKYILLKLTSSNKLLAMTSNLCYR